MGFFDLNIPYTESNKWNSTTDKSTRLKLAVKAMELGYTGVAYNRTITGVMSEADRCSISLFPLSSVLNVSPSISSSVNLHRRLLNVPTTTPFRQYTRLTVVVDTPAQGSALNSGNPVLKTYDIVAVRPLKQDSFDQACKNYEVDIIAIDFSENRFRLKQPLVKAAIERGVYFEITYSSLLMDAQLRRQMISNAKLLVDWTRGKNVIFTSAAPSVTEFRGPYDVANLASLLGFSNERAKASVSKTCRSLIENSLRKKKFHKEAIKIQLISSTDKEGDGFDDWLKWDPISSGEGDLQLDDMAKSFAATNKESKTVKAIDFVSIIDELPSNGLQIKDIVSQTKSEPKTNKPTAVNDMHIDSKVHDPPENNQILSENDTCEDLVNADRSETCDMIIDEETKILSDSNVCISCDEAEQEKQNTEAEVDENKCEENAIDENVISDVPSGGNSILVDDNHNPCSTVDCEEANNRLSSFNASLPEEFLEGDVAVTPVCSSSNEKVLEHSSVSGEDVSVAPTSTLPCLRSDDELQNNDANSVVPEPLEDVSVKPSERVRRKQRSSHRSVSIPFKRLLKPSHFKKSRKHKSRNTILSLSELID